MSGPDSGKKGESPKTAASLEGQSEIDDILNEVEAIRRELSGEPAVNASTQRVTAEPVVPAEPRVTGAEGSGEKNPDPSPVESKENGENGENEENKEDENHEEDEEDSELLKEFRRSLVKTDAPRDPDFQPLTDDQTEDEEEAGLEEALSSLDADDSLMELDGFSASSGTESERSQSAAFDEGKSQGSPALASVSNLSHLSKFSRSSPTPRPQLVEGEPKKDAEPWESRTASSASPGSLSLLLSGQMTLKLRYDFEGQEVAVSFTDGFLKIELTDGTELKIPVGKVRKSVPSAA